MGRWRCDDTLLSVSCVRDGALRLTLPSIRLHVQSLQMLAAPLGVASLENGAGAAARHATATSGRPFAPPLAALFPLPAEVEQALSASEGPGSAAAAAAARTLRGIPLATVPCRLAVTATVAFSPVSDALLSLASAE